MQKIHGGWHCWVYFLILFSLVQKKKMLLERSCITAHGGFSIRCTTAWFVLFNQSVVYWSSTSSVCKIHVQRAFSYVMLHFVTVALTFLEEWVHSWMYHGINLGQKIGVFGKDVKKKKKKGGESLFSCINHSYIIFKKSTTFNSQIFQSKSR